MDTCTRLRSLENEIRAQCPLNTARHSSNWLITLTSSNLESTPGARADKIQAVCFNCEPPHSLLPPEKCQQGQYSLLDKGQG